MKKKQIVKEDEAFAQLFATSFKFVQNSTLSFIEIYQNKYKMLKREMVEHEDNEPLKIFKNAHRKWEIKKENLNIELEKTFNDLMEEYKDFGDLINIKTYNNY